MGRDIAWRPWLKTQIGPGWRDEMTFLWKQEQHNLNEFCRVEREALLTRRIKVERETNTGSQIKEKKQRELEKGGPEGCLFRKWMKLHLKDRLN